MRNNLTKLIALLVIVTISNGAYAKIWRLNNNGNNQIPAITADFPTSTTLQQAHDNAIVASGDTLHVEQSPTTYGACVFTKRLVVIGPGYFLSSNPNTQVNTSFGATVGNLTFYTAGGASSQVFGLTTGNVYMGVNNLLIARCNITGVAYIGNTSTGNIDGMTLRQNYMNVASQTAIQNNTGTGSITNMTIQNNIVVNGGYSSGVILGANISGLIKSNTVQCYYAPFNVYNFYILDNISYSGASYANTFNNCNIEFNAGNVAGQYQTPGGANNTVGSGNLVKSQAQITYVGGTSTDGAYQLNSASEVKGVGKDGMDLGAFAADYPYKLSGIAPVPNIYGLV
ncbi:MAG: hypothetical protein ACMG51_07100, partial [Ginsengibacter sp.]